MTARPSASLVILMSVNVNEGDNAPNFTAPDQNGDPVSLKDFAGRHVLLYFYPKDNTSGCTNEAKQFAKNMEDFNELGAHVIGVSADSVGSHKDFAQKANINFPILADPDMNIINNYGVGKGDTAMRISFLIDTDGKVEKVYDAVSPESHANEVLNDLRTITQSA